MSHHHMSRGVPGGGGGHLGLCHGHRQGAMMRSKPGDKVPCHQKLINLKILQPATRAEACHNSGPDQQCVVLRPRPRLMAPRVGKHGIEQISTKCSLALDKVNTQMMPETQGLIAM